MDIDLTLSDNQYEFVNDCTTRFLALKAGYGAGKTHAFCVKSLYLSWLNKTEPGEGTHVGMMLAPTGPQGRDILMPKFEEILEDNDIPYTVVKHPLPEYMLYFAGGQAKILVRSAENYKRLVGHNLAWFGVDEVDTIKASTAWHMWRKLQARLRAQAPYVQGFTTSTPEGFNFMYQFWVQMLDQDSGVDPEDRKMITATTYENQENLEPGYIQSLLKTYPANLIRSYLNGEFVNINSGNVYYAFDRFKNNTRKVVTDFDDPENEVLADIHIGVDFNVDKCVGIIHCIDPKTKYAYAVDEIVKQLDTQHLIAAIKKKYDGRTIYVYPDASGRARKTSANKTDLQLLKQAGFKVKVDSKNPFVKDRVNAMNAMFENAEKEIRYYVNVRNCKTYVEALETQGYTDSGDPDKSTDVDHPVDAGGYFIHKMYPIRRKISKVKIMGF